MRDLKLTNSSKKCILDDSDYETASYFNWYVIKDKYILNTRKLTQRALHTFIMNPPPGYEVDHINGNTFDNRRANLRTVTRSQNLMNRRKQKPSVSSSFKGVCWNKQCRKWQATISSNGKSKYLGLFVLERDAAKAYNNAAIEDYREYSSLNNLGE